MGTDRLEKKNRLMGAVKEILAELGWERYAPWVVGGVAWLSEEKIEKVYDTLKRWIR